MIAAASRIVDEFGHPFRTEPTNGRSEVNRLRLQLKEMRRRRLDASYDAARNGDEYKNIWVNADRYDADSANSRSVREVLVSRSRHEIQNNGFSDGIAQTYATDLIGVGPMLRMQTGSTGFNQMVELAWYLWSKAIQFRRKLWCMAHAKHSDGESIAVMRNNPRSRNPIQLDIRLYETEHCQTPLGSLGDFLDPNYIDGIRFDEFGNPLWYDLLQQHPGSSNGFSGDMTAERVPAEAMLHWFKLRRPGQHRGVPECASTLNTGAAGRRFREATLAAAETAADYTVLLKTTMLPDQLAESAAMSSVDIEKRMMTALPLGYEAQQMKAEHPTAGYESFHRSIINEQARPKNMPFNKAACDSASYNYASGRLDHQTYYAALDVEREDCNDLVLDPLFEMWWPEAVRVYGWLGGRPDEISERAKLHLWDWPKHRVADVEAEANANKTRMQSAQTTLTQIYSDAGIDYEDAIQKEAEAFGVTVEQMRMLHLNAVFPGAALLLNPPAQPPAMEVQPNGQR